MTPLFLRALAKRRAHFSLPPRGALLATMAYGAVVLAFLMVVAGTLGDLIARYADAREERQMLDRLSGLAPGGTAGGDARGAAGEKGSLFLEGPTPTVAGATLVERLSSAVERAGGRISSSRLEVEEKRWEPGFLSAEVSLDIAEAGVQRLLYEIEAGLPFLYVGELAIQGGPATSDGTDGQLKVVLTAYGRWRGAP